MQTTFRIPAMRPLLPRAEACLPYLAKIDANRWYSNFGPLADELAHRLGRHFGIERSGVCLSANATLALAALLQDVSAKRPGALCLMPSWTFAATAHAVCLAGLKPKFVDVDAVSGQMTPALAAAALDDSVAALVVVSPFGSQVAPDVWERFAATHGVAIVIDAAAAFDTVIASSLPSVVSLHATKPVSAGEGAFIICRDEDLVERTRRRTNFGFDAGRVSTYRGMNAKLSEYGAAIALAGLDHWPKARAALLAQGARYASRLAPLGVSLQSGWGKTWISTTLNVRIDDPGLNAERISNDLARSGIDARRWWGEGCHRQLAFRHFAEGPLPNTEDLIARMLGLPFYGDLGADELDEVVTRLGAALVASKDKKDQLQ